MVKLDKIYTRGGDKGYTSIIGGKRVRKSSILIETIGNIDELNAILGLAIASLDTKKKEFLENIQNDLFDIGADLATPLSKKKNVIRLNKNQIVLLENKIDEINRELSPLKSFILPGGDKVSALLHLARTVCRRSEIQLVKLLDKKNVNSEILIYINRLSDFLFVLARQTNRREVLWKPLKNK